MTHPFQVARLLQRREVDAPASPDFRTVEAVEVDGFITLFFDRRRLRSFRVLRLLRRRLLLCCDRFLRLRSGLLVFGRIDLVRRQHVMKADGVCQQLFHDRHDIFHALHRDAVEAEAFRLLALAVKVGEEIIQRVAMTVEAQKILRVFRSGGFQVRRAVALQSRDHADLARFLVPDDQHVLFSLFLFHILLSFIGLHPLDALRI